jgi:hypothetical protein
MQTIAIANHLRNENEKYLRILNEKGSLNSTR